MEDVADPSAPRKLMGFDVSRCPLDLLAVGGGELGESGEKGGPFVLNWLTKSLQRINEI